MIFRVPLHFRALARYILRIGGIFKVDAREALKLMGPSNVIKFHRAVLEQREIWNFIGSDELFLTMGKARLVYDKYRAFVVDTYVFYPTCTKSEIHFQGCTCPDENKRWEFFSKYISTPIIIARLLKRMARYIKIRICDTGFDINFLGLEFRFLPETPNKRTRTIAQFGLDADFISIMISDWVFSKIGRPFITVIEIDLELLEKAAAAAREILSDCCDDEPYGDD